MGNWSELQTDLLGLIAEKLTVAADRVRFSGVCQNWSAVAQSESNYFPCSPPWLMLVEKPDEEDSSLRGFAGLAGRECFDLDLSIPKGAKCAGSAGCWVVVLELVGDMYLLNPFTRAKIDLPPLSEFEDYKGYCEENPDMTADVLMRDHFLSEKVVLSFPKSKSPEDDFVAVAIFDGKLKKSLAYTTKGAKSWKTVEQGEANSSWKPTETPIYFGFYDVTFYQGKFYAVNGLGSVFEFSISYTPNDHKPKLVPISGPSVGHCQRKYLVEFQGMLLQVLKYVDFLYEDKDNFDYNTLRCSVLKLDFLTREWVELNDLGQYSIFVGFNTCVSLLASSTSTFKPNCIYFTDDFRIGYLHRSMSQGGRDMGVFNLVDSTIEPHYTGPCSLSSFSPPIWVIPTTLYHRNC